MDESPERALLRKLLDGDVIRPGLDFEEDKRVYDSGCGCCSGYITLTDEEAALLLELGA